MYSESSTPTAVRYVFAVGIIGTIWSILILITFIRANNVSYTIAFFDFVGMVVFIVGVILLTKPAVDDCAVAKANGNADNDIARTNNVGQLCGLLRASWGLAIANIVFYFLLVLIGYQIASIVEDEYKRLGGPVARRTVIEEGYPAMPAVRNVTQTTTAAIPLQPGVVPVAAMSERDRSSRRQRSSSKSRERRHKHSSSKEKRRKSYASTGSRDDYYYPDRRDSRRSSRRDY